MSTTINAGPDHGLNPGDVIKLNQGGLFAVDAVDGTTLHIRKITRWQLLVMRVRECWRSFVRGWRRALESSVHEHGGHWHP